MCRTMLTVIFQSLPAHNIAYVQHFTSTHLYIERHVGNACKNIFKGNFVCAPSLFVCAHQTPCVPQRARTHNLEGTLVSNLFQ